MMFRSTLAILVCTLVCLPLCLCFKPSRLCVVKNRIGNANLTLAVRTVADGTVQNTPSAVVQISYRNSDSANAAWSQWTNIGAPLQNQSFLSNPACVYSELNQTQIFIQAADGQVYSSTQSSQSFLEFSPWARIGTNKLPAESAKGPLVDSVSAVWYGKILMVFARSLSASESRLYWCRGNPTSFGSWGLLAGSTILGTDATFVLNPFSGKYEGFMLSTGGKMHRTWQHNDHSFAGWKTMANAPTFSTDMRPAAHVMGYDIFNGKLMVSGMGKDGIVRECGQSTCDKVDNPWGYCTWGSWYQVGGKILFTGAGVENNLIMTRNVHFGVEAFIVDQPGQLWKSWQLERGASFQAWEKVPHDTSYGAIASLPYFTVDDKGWWEAYALNASGQIITVQPPRSIEASPRTVPWGNNLTVSWSVSADQVLRRDWVAIFPRDAKNDQYVDYRYVQGGLNPGKKAVAVGAVNMASFLPNGSYDVRYLVNRNYISIIDTTVTYTDQSQESETMQLFRGIYKGLGVTNDSIQACVKEGELTIETFRQSFEAFAKEQIITGLHLFGQALIDVAHSLQICEETKLFLELTTFIKDLVSCTRDDCTHFVIDIIKELLILYEDRYEIYGDIKGASNNFNIIHAYQQGGLCIGRLVRACLGMHME
ncbi:uncharacterized protein [Diadema antillarum]|uniref:uncharacterized protein n=1 Tax=Diadema antillarum TaxID=105358 RepID=UPI003A845B9A